MFSKGAKDRRKDFKKGIDAEDARRKREEISVELRKSKREEQLSKTRRVRTDTLLNNNNNNNNNQNAQAKPEQTTRDPAIEEKLRALPTLAQNLVSDDSNLQMEAVVQFRKLLSIERNPPIQEVIDVGVVPRLVQMLTFQQTPTLQFEAAWALTNIASGTTKHTQTVIEHGAIGVFVQLLRSPSADVREQAVWALGNIAGDSATYRDLVLRAGALEPLTALCVPDAKATMLRNATWTLSNFCRGKPQPPFELVSPALGILARLIYSKDDEVLTDACWALSYLSDDTGPQNQKIQAVVQSGVVRRLVELLMHNNANVKTPALRTIGNIVTGDDLQTQVVIHCGALTCLLALLNNSKKGIRKEACWTISNITAGNQEQIQAVISANLIQPLVSTLKTADFDIKKEAAWAISNATSGGSDEQIRYLVGQGVISPLCDLFRCPDPKIIMVALEGIENILRVGAKDAPRNENVNKFGEYVDECHGLDYMEELQRHDNEEIYRKANSIIKKYFDVDDGDEETTPAAVQGSEFALQSNNTTFKF